MRAEMGTEWPGVVPEESGQAMHGADEPWARDVCGWEQLLMGAAIDGSSY